MIQSAEAAEKARSINVKSQLETAKFERQQAREDAMTAAKIAALGLPKGSVP
jgi:hypothetical protein